MAIAEMPLAGTTRVHTYHGTASLFDLDLKEPFEQIVRPQAKLELKGGGETSHYQFQQSGPFQLEGICSYRSGYTQVAGARSRKHEGRFSTLATSVLEGLNILNVLTADRVVSQITTAHPIDGAVPEVSFIGTHFDNLRIAGHKVEFDADLEILGPRPVEDQSFFDNRDVMDRMAQQYEKLTHSDYYPDWAGEKYPRDREGWRSKNGNPNVDIAQCSLFNRVQNYQKSFGHVVEVPHFGKFYLGELQVKREKAKSQKEYDTYSFHLTMVRMELGCAGSGSGGGGTTGTNGVGGIRS